GRRRGAWVRRADEGRGQERRALPGDRRRGGVDPRRGGAEGLEDGRAAYGAARAPGGRDRRARHAAGEHGRMTHELEGLGAWRRTHTCGELTRTQAGQKVTLMGWLHRSRDHGGVLFTDLRDRYGLTQVVFHPETGGKVLLDRASRLGNEFVIAVRGVVM